MTRSSISKIGKVNSFHLGRIKYDPLIKFTILVVGQHIYKVFHVKLNFPKNRINRFFWNHVSGSIFDDVLSFWVVLNFFFKFRNKNCKSVIFGREVGLFKVSIIYIQINENQRSKMWVDLGTVQSPHPGTKKWKKSPHYDTEGFDFFLKIRHFSLLIVLFK